MDIENKDKSVEETIKEAEALLEETKIEEKPAAIPDQTFREKLEAELEEKYTPKDTELEDETIEVIEW